MKNVNVFMICFCFLTASLMSNTLFGVDYNYLPTGREFISPAGLLPKAGWAPEEDKVLNVQKFGALGPCTLERIGTSGKIFFNAYANITISNSGMRDIENPCPDAKVVLSNV